MRAVFTQLLKGRGNFDVVSEKGATIEIFGAILELSNPRARSSRSLSKAKIFSPLGELFWYLAGSDSVEFIEHYIPTYGELIKNKVKANGAYGPRIFGENAGEKRANSSEWDRVIRTLREREGSRNAVIQIFSNADARPKNGDKPCTCTIQFAIRKKQLLMHTHMRSNDAFMGLPHDIFTFTMLQEIAARELVVGLGRYTHSVASLHLYHENKAAAESYIREGLHDIQPMPNMPMGDPWDSIEVVKKLEQEIRCGNTNHPTPTGLNPYWSDIIALFRIHKIFAEIKARKDDLKGARPDLRRIVDLMNGISPKYKIYILDRLERKEPQIRDLFESIGNEREK